MTLSTTMNSPLSKIDIRRLEVLNALKVSGVVEGRRTNYTPYTKSLIKNLYENSGCVSIYEFSKVTTIAPDHLKKLMAQDVIPTIKTLMKIRKYLGIIIYFTGKGRGRKFKATSEGFAAAIQHLGYDQKRAAFECNMSVAFISKWIHYKVGEGGLSAKFWSRAAQNLKLEFVVPDKLPKPTIDISKHFK